MSDTFLLVDEYNINLNTSTIWEPLSFWENGITGMTYFETQAIVLCEIGFSLQSDCMESCLGSAVQDYDLPDTYYSHQASILLHAGSEYFSPNLSVTCPDTTKLLTHIKFVYLPSSSAQSVSIKSWFQGNIRKTINFQVPRGDSLTVHKEEVYFDSFASGEYFSISSNTATLYAGSTPTMNLHSQDSKY